MINWQFLRPNDRCWIVATSILLTIGILGFVFFGSMICLLMVLIVAALNTENILFLAKDQADYVDLMMRCNAAGAHN